MGPWTLRYSRISCIFCDGGLSCNGDLSCQGGIPCDENVLPVMALWFWPQAGTPLSRIGTQAGGDKQHPGGMHQSKNLHQVKTKGSLHGQQSANEGTGVTNMEIKS